MEYKMKLFILQLLVIISLTQYETIDPINGPLSTDIAFSENGQVIATSLVLPFKIRVYENTGSSFVFSSEFSVPFAALMIAVNYDGSKIYAIVFSKIYIYQKI